MRGPREFKQASLDFTQALSIRHFGPYQEVNETWAKLTQAAFNLGIAGPDVVAFGLSYDDPTTTPLEKIRYDACLSISKVHFNLLTQRFEAEEVSEEPQMRGVRAWPVSFGQTMMTVHRGSYGDIREAYTDLLREVAFSAKTREPPRPPFIEVYRNNPLLTRSQDLITEIHMRLP
jgi:AraC family transcriptional regulator